MSAIIMKVVAWATLLTLNLAGHAVATQGRGEAHTTDRTISKVVKMLQGLLEKSQLEGETEQTLFGKFKCYCDQNKEEKTKSIEEAAEQLEMLSSAIAELKAANGAASSAAAKFKVSLEENDAAQQEMVKLDKDASKEFADLQSDLTVAIEQMADAIKVLSEVGADQTLSTAADHTRFMAGYGDASLIKLQTNVKKALTAASVFLPDEKRQSVDAFLQAPFTGTYTAQSGQVVGILKQMRDTFSTNLDSAVVNERKRKTAFAEGLATKKEEYEKLSAAYQAKQSELSSNDGELAAKKEQFASLKQQKSSDEDFLAELVPMCETKAKEYGKRKELRATEEAAISEAISILNSDAAFATFGEVDATKDGKTDPAALLQLRSIRAHVLPQNGVRDKAVSALDRFASHARQSTLKVNKIASLLQAGNPFDVVLAEIDKMLATIVEEGTKDAESRDWCIQEQDKIGKEMAEKNSDISDLGDEIAKLQDIIERPVTGLVEQIAKSEADLKANQDNQKTEAATRKEANTAYQTDVKNLQKAEDLLQRAVAVLNKYYEKLRQEEGAFVQTYDSPDPPSTWEGSYQGAANGGGNKALEMLQYILAETQKEEAAAHADEKEAQADYEDMISQLKEQEVSLQESLSSLQQTLADRQKELVESQQELKETEAEAAALLAYSKQIEPGCLFMLSNFADREAFRAAESQALQNAKELLKASPSYLAAEADAYEKSLGSCVGACHIEASVDCKACLADTSVPAYCAANPTTLGCTLDVMS